MKQHIDIPMHLDPLPPMIILAGGRSQRFGSPKGLAKVGEETYLFSHIATYAQVGSRCVVVLGFYTDPYIADIERANVSLREKSFKTEYTVNKTHDLGPFSSIQSGLEKLAFDAGRGVFIQPVDTGIVPASIYAELFLASDNGLYSVTPECRGKGGHPVFVSADFAARLLMVDPASEFARLDYQLRAEPSGKVRRLPVASSEILLNKNIPN